MHFFDIVILVITAVYAGLGIKRGFISEVFRCAAVVAGFIAALLLYQTAYDRLGFIMMPNQAKTAVAFLLVYIAAAIAVLGAGWLVKKLVRLTLFGWVDRLLGACIGCAKAALLVWILMMCVAIVPHSRIYSMINTSRTYRFFSALPLRLRSPAASHTLPSLRTVVDIDRPLETLREARERLGGFREKVDSAKAFADSLKKQAHRDTEK
mgnify:CR=1 FL=1